jgi:hypothetical protein
VDHGRRLRHPLHEVEGRVELVDELPPQPGPLRLIP